MKQYRYIDVDHYDPLHSKSKLQITRVINNANLSLDISEEYSTSTRFFKTIDIINSLTDMLEAGSEYIDFSESEGYYVSDAVKEIVIKGIHIEIESDDDFRERQESIESEIKRKERNKELLDIEQYKELHKKYGKK